MKSLIRICSFSLLLLASNLSFSAQDVQSKVMRLEKSMLNLQQQITDLKREMGDDISVSNAERIANLEAFAVQLNDVITEVQAQIEDNATEVTRVARIQNKQPNLGMYGTIVAGKQNNENSVIDGQSFEIILSGQPHKRLSYFTELEFERAATVGGDRGGEVLLEQAYTDLELTSWANFRAGILLVPFGNIEKDHYAPLREVISKPYTAIALAPSDWTDNGFGFNGKFNIADNWLANYQAYILAGLDNNISTTGLRKARQGFGEDNNNDKAIAAKISIQNTSGFNAGVSVYNGAWDDAGNRDITGVGINLGYQWRWLEIFGEYDYMDVEREVHGSAIMDGYYIRGIVSLEHFLPDNWLGDDFPLAKLSLVGQYDTVNIENFFDSGIPDNSESRYTIGLRLAPVRSWIASFNYENASASGPDTILRGDNDIWLFSIGYVF